MCQSVMCLDGCFQQQGGTTYIIHVRKSTHVELLSVGVFRREVWR
jgi:hypothetical protein